MAEGKTSIELYSALAKKLLHQKYALAKGELEQLLKAVKGELIISGRSPLMDAAYWSCCLFCSSQRIPNCRYEPACFFLSDAGKRTEIPFFDAWCLIIFLSKYMPNSAIAEDIDQLLPYFFRNYMPKNPNINELLRALQSIDAEVRTLRGKMYKLYVSAPGNDAPEAISNEPAPEPDRKKPDAHTPTAFGSPDRQDAGGAARKRTGERQSIIDAAQKEADGILRRASLEAEKKISAAKKRFGDMVENRQVQKFSSEQQRIQQDFSEVRAALLQANGMIKRLEDSISEAATRKVSSQLLELFNLIADAKESAFLLARQNNDQDLENTAYNMDVFLDMITEYMAEHGVQPIASMPGDKFSAQRHTIEAGSPQFDPRTATIKLSKRTGFLWGENVLQKERVEI